MDGRQPVGAAAVHLQATGASTHNMLSCAAFLSLCVKHTRAQQVPVDCNAWQLHTSTTAGPPVSAATDLQRHLPLPGLAPQSMQLVICLTASVQDAWAHHVCVQAPGPIGAQHQLLTVEGAHSRGSRAPVGAPGRRCRAGSSNAVLMAGIQVDPDRHAGVCWHCILRLYTANCALRFTCPCSVQTVLL